MPFYTDWVSVFTVKERIIDLTGGSCQFQDGCLYPKADVSQ